MRNRYRSSAIGLLLMALPAGAQDAAAPPEPLCLDREFYVAGEEVRFTWTNRSERDLLVTPSNWVVLQGREIVQRAPLYTGVVKLSRNESWSGSWNQKDARGKLVNAGRFTLIFHADFRDSAAEFEVLPKSRGTVLFLASLRRPPQGNPVVRFHLLNRSRKEIELLPPLRIEKKTSSGWSEVGDPVSPPLPLSSPKGGRSTWTWDPGTAGPGAYRAVMELREAGGRRKTLTAEFEIR